MTELIYRIICGTESVKPHSSLDEVLCKYLKAGFHIIVSVVRIVSAASNF